jgi:exportin-2 (importin alpha re-exporter)
LQAYIEKAAGSIVTEKIMGVLGVFQRLMASKSNDHYAFYILNSLTEYLAPQVLSQYVKQIFVLLFQRLTSSKTTKLVKNMLIFFSLYAYKYGCNNLMELIESMQQGMFLMVLEKLYISDLQKVSGNVDRKICAVGVTKIICECPVLLSNENYLKIWISLLESLIGLFELPEDTSTADDEHFIDVEDTPGYSGSFNQLYSATKTDPDPFKGEIPNPKFYLSKNLENLSSTIPSKIQQFLSQLTPASQNHLQVYLKEANALLR